jgi:hypothetical protein
MPFFVFPFSSVATYCTYTIQSFSFLACPTGKIMKRLTMASRAYHEEEEDTTCTKTRRDLLVWTTRADRSEQITRKPISIPVRDARADLLNLKLLIKKDRKMMTSLCDRPAVLDPRSNSRGTQLLLLAVAADNNLLQEEQKFGSGRRRRQRTCAFLAEGTTNKIFRRTHQKFRGRSRPEREFRV